MTPTFKENILDLVLSSDPHAIYNITVAAPLGTLEKNSLHSSLDWNLVIEERTTNFEKNCIPAFWRGNYEEINKYFHQLDWDSTFDSKNTKDCYQVFLEHYNFACLK